MEPVRLIEIMELAEKLKNTPRHSWTSEGRRESVAEHCWRLCFFAYFIKDEFPDADMEKVMLMCVMHDFGEVFTGDIPVFEKTSAHEETEDAALQKWVNSLPEPYRGELDELYGEISRGETEESRIFKALDCMEAVMQHNQADISTWLPLEFELQLTHGADKAAFSEYLSRLRGTVSEDAQKKIDEYSREKEQ
jgi:putative hydrolases of HD superfamily